VEVEGQKMEIQDKDIEKRKKQHYEERGRRNWDGGRPKRRSCVINALEKRQWGVELWDGLSGGKGGPKSGIWKRSQEGRNDIYLRREYEKNSFNAKNFGENGTTHHYLEVCQGKGKTKGE